MKKYDCAICGGLVVLDECNICDVCGWEADTLQEEEPDYPGGANVLSLNEHKIAYMLSQNPATYEKERTIWRELSSERARIYCKYKDVNYRTADGDKVSQELAEAHSRYAKALDTIRHEWEDTQT